MSIIAWPFLISRNRSLGYRTIVAPDFVCDANSAGLLADAAGTDEGGTVNLGEAIYREVQGAKVGGIALIFRVIHAQSGHIGQEGSEFLRDDFGRIIDLIEGFVIHGKMPDILVDDDIFDSVHRQVEIHYRNFWNTKSASPVAPASSFVLTANKTAFQAVPLKVVKPYTSGSPYPTNVQRKKTWKPVDILPFEYPVTSIAFNQTGNLLAIRLLNQQIILHDIDRHHTAKLDKFCTINSNSESSITFNPTGEVLVSGIVCPTFFQRETFVGMLYVNTWRIENEPYGAGIFNPKQILSVCYSPNGNFRAIGDTEGTVQFKVLGKSFKLLKIQHGSRGVHTTLFSPNSQSLVSGGEDGTIKIWQIDSILTNAHPIPKILADNLGPIKSIAFSIHGQQIICADEDREIKMWDVGSNRDAQTFIGHRLSVNSIAVKPRSQVLASGSDDKSVKIWDIGTRKEIFNLQEHDAAVNVVTFNPSGDLLVSGSNDGVVKIWNMSL